MAAHAPFGSTAGATTGPRSGPKAGSTHSAVSGRKSRFRIGIALILAASFWVSGCGNDPEPAVSSNTGSAAKLSGSPYTYYVIYSSLTTSPFPEVPKAAQLGVDEVNDSGGINGRPLQLKTCPVNLDPNKAADCARTAVSDPSVIAMNVWYGQPDAAFAVLTKAMMPVVGTYPLTLADFSCEVCFPISAGAFATAAGQGLLAGKRLKAQRVSFVVLDIPAGRGLVPVVSQLLQAAGLPTKVVNTVPVPITAGDLSAQVTAASKDVDAVLVTLTPDLLPRFLQTAKQLAVRVPIVSTPIEKQKAPQLGAAGDGVYWTGTFNQDSAGWKEYESAFTARYPDEVAAEWGYAVRFGAKLLQRVSKGQPEVTRDSVLAAVTKLTSVDTGGATPPLDFTKRFGGFGGKVPRLFNNTIVFYQVKGGSVKQLSGFEQLLPTQ
jgi:branched-chain amino acid transport system substrate-binding protein